MHNNEPREDVPIKTHSSLVSVCRFAERFGAFFRNLRLDDTGCDRTGHANSEKRIYSSQGTRVFSNTEAERGQVIGTTNRNIEEVNLVTCAYRRDESCLVGLLPAICKVGGLYSVGNRQWTHVLSGDGCSNSSAGNEGNLKWGLQLRTRLTTWPHHQQEKKKRIPILAQH